MQEKAVSFSYKDAQEKYRKLIWGGALFAFLGLAMMGGGYLFFHFQGAYKPDAPQAIYPLVPFFMLFIIVYGWNILKQGLLHARLYKKSVSQGLKLDSKGLCVSTLLLEGVYGDALVKEKKADFSFDWDDINHFIVEPRRGDKNGSPPYYKITFVGHDEDMNSSCYILRDGFKGDEKNIIEFVRAHIDDERLILNDEINN